jgi:hypothetical protein
MPERGGDLVPAYVTTVRDSRGHGHRGLGLGMGEERGRGGVGELVDVADHVGLVGMQERVRLYGGRLETGARPGGGFRAHVVLRSGGS